MVKPRKRMSPPMQSGCQGIRIGRIRWSVLSMFKTKIVGRGLDRSNENAFNVGEGDSHDAQLLPRGAELFHDLEGHLVQSLGLAAAFRMASCVRSSSRSCTRI